MDNARDATQIFGGYGFMNENPVARHYRDSKILEIGEGTTRGAAHGDRAGAGLRRGARDDARDVEQRGLYYEELELDTRYLHRPGRTVTEADNVLFTHADHEHAGAAPRRRVVRRRSRSGSGW